jgi:hypothetical protein
MALELAESRLQAGKVATGQPEVWRVEKPRATSLTISASRKLRPYEATFSQAMPYFAGVALVRYGSRASIEPEPDGSVAAGVPLRS